MKFLFKNLLLIIIFSGLLITSAALADNSIRGLEGFEWQSIDAVKNARGHSNMGNIYFKEQNYISALKEYQIAYNLTYNLNSSSTYLYNIAVCFLKLNNYAAAKSAIEGAIEKNCMNMTYYKTLVDIYIALGTYDSELRKHLSDNSNPYNRIISALIFIKTGNTMQAKTLLDEFITLYPDMIITDDIKAILSKL